MIIPFLRAYVNDISSYVVFHCVSPLHSHKKAQSIFALFLINSHMVGALYSYDCKPDIFLFQNKKKKADKPHRQHFCFAKASLRLSALLGGARYQLITKAVL